MKSAFAFAVLAAAACSTAQQREVPMTTVAASPPPIVVSNSPPPPIVAVPMEPPLPSVILVPPVAVTNSPQPLTTVVTPQYPPMPATGSAPVLPEPTIVEGPQPRRPAQAYFSAADYPASAVAQRAEGWVEVLLTVGADGRVHGCTITASSGFSVLDSATCMIMRRRARFTPARTNQGMPSVGLIHQVVEWRLPR